MPLLCLDEETPIVLALCLFGCIFIIAGGGLWGKESDKAVQNMTDVTAGKVLLTLGGILIILGCIGMTCNRWFCTPKRKSKIALTIYRGTDKSPTNYTDSDLYEDDVDGEDMGDWGSKTSYKSLRSSRRSLRLKRGTSLRDKIQPSPGPAVSPSQLPVSLTDVKQDPPIRVTSKATVRLGLHENGVTNSSTGSVRTHSLTDVQTHPHPIPMETGFGPNAMDLPPAHFAETNVVIRDWDQHRQQHNSSKSNSQVSDTSLAVSDHGNALVSIPVTI